MRLSQALLIIPLVAGVPLQAHDLPQGVVVHAFIKAEPDNRLRLMVRVPLHAIRDVEIPEFGSGYLDIQRFTPELPDAATLWISNFTEVYEGQQQQRLPSPKLIAARISPASDHAFDSYQQALQLLTASPRTPNDAKLTRNSAFLDVLFEYPVQSSNSQFSIRTGWWHLASTVTTVLRFVTPGGEVRLLQYHGDPGVLPLDPSWLQAATRFLRSGFVHILEGPDHLLFLCALVIPFGGSRRHIRSLVIVVTAFTVAHSITLSASAFGFTPGAAWFAPWIETVIAASIVFMAAENIVESGADPASSLRRRWAITFLFGLAHGFGFSFALRETLQFAGSHLITSLIFFNVGVEAGQLLVLGLLLPVLALPALRPRIATVLLSALIAHTGWHWMRDRWDVLARLLFPQ